MLAVIIGNGNGFHPGRQVGQSHIADSTFGLAYRLDHGSGGGHGQAAAHVVLVLQGAFFEKFVSSRRGFARIDNDFHIGSPQLFPIGYLAAEYAAVRAEWLDENPFMLLSASERVKKPESKRQFLTIEEVKLLIATECRNKTVKQAYLFSCYCGLRLSDMETLCWKDIICNDGRYMIGKVQQKTSTPIYTPLSQSAVKWLPERNADDSDETLVFATLPSRMTTNKILRQWVEKAGIDKKITYHTSRHTFGTMMMTVGADLYTTCKLMGHADVRTTQIYAKIVDSKKIEAVDMVDKMFEQEEAKD